MPVFIIKNEEFGNLAFCTMNEGLGKVLRYGAYSEDVIKKLKWMESTLYPILRRAIEKIGKINSKTTMMFSDYVPLNYDYLMLESVPAI